MLGDYYYYFHFTIKKINQDKWKDYTGLMLTSTLRFPFHDFNQNHPLIHLVNIIKHILCAKLCPTH